MLPESALSRRRKKSKTLSDIQKEPFNGGGLQKGRTFFQDAPNTGNRPSLVFQEVKDPGQKGQVAFRILPMAAPLVLEGASMGKAFSQERRVATGTPRRADASPILYFRPETLTFFSPAFSRRSGSLRNQTDFLRGEAVFFGASSSPQK